jgi:UTP-glucose-1-phosphate uridylyltransferase
MKLQEKALVIMAAGLGSRYGGNKQVDRIGPDGEILMQYSIYDAIKSGFTKIVFIIKPQYTGLIEEISADARANGIKTEIVYQDFSSIPDFYSIPTDRTKPFGTVHAVLSAKDAITEPFAIINADDFYGRDAFATMSKALDNVSSGVGAMVAYELKNTVSKNGSVTRGVCQTDNGKLTKIVEVFDISLLNNGIISDKTVGILDPEPPVSMNMWGFTPDIFEAMNDSFCEFLRNIQDGDIKAEYPLPSFIGKEINESRLSINVYTTDSEWFGVTYAEDRPAVAERLINMKDNNTYPTKLKL